MKMITFYASMPQHRAIKDFSEKLGISKAEVIRRALDEYFYKERRRLRLEPDPLALAEKDSNGNVLIAEEGDENGSNKID